MSAEADGTLVFLLQSYFPVTYYNITYKYPFYEIKDLRGDLCLTFGIDDTAEMYVESIDKCSGTAGNDIVQRIVWFAKSYGCRKINLVDAARLIVGISRKNTYCKFKIYLLSILTTGQSWYNKFGFVSDNYENEVANNRNLMNITVGDFINKGLKKSTPITSAKIRSTLDTRASDFYERPVKDVVQELINTKLKPSTGGINNVDCDDPDLVWLNTFLSLATGLITYNSYLVYNIGERKGGRRRKKTTRKTRRRKGGVTAF
jgi:hypothetical protein